MTGNSKTVPVDLWDGHNRHSSNCATGTIERYPGHTHIGWYIQAFCKLGKQSDGKVVLLRTTIYSMQHVDIIWDAYTRDICMCVRSVGGVSGHSPKACGHGSTMPKGRDDLRPTEIDAPVVDIARVQSFITLCT